MNFLAIDTSGSRLIVAVRRGEENFFRAEESAMRHSVLLMDGIDGALNEARLSLRELDFIACAVGPGSFTGIRIGISAVKGLCLAAELPALALTSFDCLAYADRKGKRVALIDAGHGNFYARAYEDERAELPSFCGNEQVNALFSAGYRAVTDGTCDRAEGLVNAALALHMCAAPASELSALYLRKSAAEEKR